MIWKQAFLFATAFTAFAADPAVTDLYVGGAGGYHSYRIPALLATKKGTLLAFCEARKNSARDDGDIDLVVRRSSDGGTTWSPMTLVQEEGGDAPITIGNPSPVQDRRTGVIHLLFTRNNQRAFEKHSRDDGATWSDAVELTDALRKFDFVWTRVAMGPGHAIQSTQDSFDCLYARRQDPATKRPLADAFAVRHFHEDLRPPNGSFTGYGLATDKLYLTWRTDRSNVWLAEPEKR